MRDNQLDRWYHGYYYLIVNISTRNLLSWILVALMVMLPLRGVMAFDQASCQMHDPGNNSAVAEMHDHSMHAMQGSPDDAGVATSSESHDCCCCDGGMNCNGDCGIGLSASLIMQSVMTVPVLNRTAIRTQINNNLISRELIPPTRPPANLYS